MKDKTLPRKFDLFGVKISATTYDEAADCIMAKAKCREPACITYLPVHGLMVAARNPDYRARINSFDIVCPDGQPVRHALRLCHDVALPDRVYGPEHMLRLCARAAAEDVSIYLYGSLPHVVNKLGEVLKERFPGLRVAGVESPPFRPLTPEEEREAVERINASGAGLVFIGLGCPRQDDFAFAHRESIHAVKLCVGAAFDFHSGNKRMAPAWMQRMSLEWLFRLSQEPGRLWSRYFTTNSFFLYLLCGAIARKALSRLRPGGMR